MRVSIVATALDGQVASTSGVVNMVNRIQNRNSGYSDGLFSTRGTVIPSNSQNTSIGATALKLDEHYEAEEALESSLNIQEENMNIQEETTAQKDNKEMYSNTPQYTSSENEINMDLPTDESLFDVKSIDEVSSSNESILTSEEEYTPKLFSNENLMSGNYNSLTETDQKIFDQENNQEEDFEIPAFLRRQKF